MTRISINLLPNETAIAEQKRQKVKFVQTISVVAFLIVVFLTSVTVALRILQNQNLAQVKDQTQQEEAKVASFKDKESDLVFLKDRLRLIQDLKALPSKARQSYRLIIEQIPVGVTVSGISVDASGNLVLTAVIPSKSAFSQLFANLTSQNVTSAVTKINIDSLSRGRDGVYRMSIKIAAKK